MVASNRRERTRAVQLWLWAPPERPKRRLPEGVDLNFRPSSYWAWPTAISPNIKGEQRRKWLKDAVSGRGTPLEEFPPGFFADSLEEPARQLVGRIHPSFMGGEYLPDYRRGEVEIARVSLRSTTGDVMSVRARPLKRGVGYRVVDEYPDMHVWRCWPKTSQVPLTLRGMIRLLDTAGLYSTEGVRFSTGLVEAYWRSELEHSTAEEAVEFATVSSDFYPHLERWYAHRAEVFMRRFGGRGRRRREG